MYRVRSLTSRRIARCPSSPISALTPCPSAHGAVNHPPALVGFLGPPLKVQVRRAAPPPLNRLQPLVNSGCPPKPVWIVVDDQPIGRVVQWLGRSVIVRQDYLP